MGPGEATVAIAGMITGIVTTGVIAWAIVQGIRAHRQGSVPRQVEEDLLALREQVDHLQQGLLETQERLDFTERMLTRGSTEREDVH